MRMRTISILVALIFALALSAQSAKKASSSPEKAKQDLLAIERSIGRANFQCDYKLFDKVEAEEFIFTDASGNVSNKKEDMAGEKDCVKHDFTYDLDDFHVTLYDNTAVVTARVTITGTNKEGKPFTRQNRFTDVFVWRDGRWQLVAGHSTRIAEKK